MIKLLLAGPREFTDLIQRQAREYPDIRIINLSTEPSHCVEALEDSAKGADAVLLGFPDDEIKLMIDVATRHEVRSVIFISVDNPGLAYRKWAKYKCKLAREGEELQKISSYFRERPELLKDQADNRDIFEDFGERAEDSRARVEEVRKREKSNRAVAVKKKVITVFGQKGGVGKTVISVSMAKSIAYLTDLKVVVLDLDMNRAYGDCVRLLGFIGPKKDQAICNFDVDNNWPAPAEKTLAAWTTFPWELRGDLRVVENFLIKDRKNLYCIPPMRSLTEEHSINYDLVQKTIGVLNRHFDVVIIDGGNTLSDTTLSALENCDEIIIVSSPELGVLDNLAEFTTDTLKSVKKVSDPLIVINKVPNKTPYDLNKELPNITGGYPLTAKFPYDQALYEKVANHASVPHLGEELTPWLEEMEKLLWTIFPRELFGKESRESKGGFLKRLFGFKKAASV